MQNNKLLLGLLIGALALLLAIGLFFAFAEEDTVSISEIVSTDSIVPQGGSAGSSYTVGDLSCTPASPHSITYFIPLKEESSGVYPTAGSSSDKVTLNQNNSTSSGYLEVDLSFENANPYLENPQVFITFTDLDLKGDRLEWKDRVVNLFETFTLHDADGNEIATLNSTHDQDNAFTWAVDLPENLKGTNFTLRAKLTTNLELEQGPAVNTIKLFNNSEMMANVSLCGNDPFEGWEIVDEEVTVEGDVTIIEGTVVIDEDEYGARYPVTRYVKTGCEAKVLPSWGIEGDGVCAFEGRFIYNTGLIEPRLFMDYTGANGTIADSTAGHLALNNIDVWIIESRGHALPAADHFLDPGTFCGDDGTACPEALGWDYASAKRETQYVHGKVSAANTIESHDVNGVVLGFGAGTGMVTLDMAGDTPEAFAGIMSNPAPLYVSPSNDEVRNHFSGLCSVAQAAVDGGVYAGDLYFRDLWDKLETYHREGPDGDVPGSLANQRDLAQHAQVFAPAPQPSALGSYDIATGDPNIFDLDSMTSQAIAAMEAGGEHALVTWFANQMIADMMCPLGGQEPYPYLDNLSNYSGPVYLHAPTGVRYHEAMVSLQEIMPNNDFTIDAPDHGFLEGLWNPNPVNGYAGKLLDWMKNTAFAN